MTKLAIMSDLHIDINQFGDFETKTLIQTLKGQEVSHLHLAGDISNHYFEKTIPFLDTMANHFDLSYNLGNHDMLDLKEASIDKMDFQLTAIGNKELLSFHGWYDYSFSDEALDKILKRKQTFWFDRRLERSLSDPQLTDQILEKLDHTLAGLDKEGLILAMHFVPHQDFTMTHERFAPFNAFLGSQRFHELFVSHGVKDVVFGHAHRSYKDQTIDGVTYHSRPLGYIREWDLTIDFVSNHPWLNPTGTWNLSKRYNLVKANPDYQAYKKAQLSQEFLNSMTLFEL